MLRSAYHQQLDRFDLEVRHLFEVVAAGLTAASTAVLQGDTTQADALRRRDSTARLILERIEHQVEETIVRQAPVASDLRFLITVLRVVPQLDRCIDLAAHVADRAPLLRGLPVPILEGYAAMAEVADRQWTDVHKAWIDREPSVAAHLDESDDELDVLADEVTELLADSPLDTVVAMECRLVVRFYERLGDHAVHVGERISWLVTGR